MCLATAIRIRTANSADTTALSGLEAMLDGEFKAYARHESAAARVARAAASAAEAQPEHPRRVLVVDWSGTVLGALSWGPQRAAEPHGPRLAVLDVLAVAGTFRRAGLARRLLADALHVMRQEGFDTVEVTAPLDALPALTRLGFLPLRPVQRSLATGEACAAVLLGKVL